MLGECHAMKRACDAVPCLSAGRFEDVCWSWATIGATAHPEAQNMCGRPIIGLIYSSHRAKEKVVDERVPRLCATMHPHHILPHLGLARRNATQEYLMDTSVAPSSSSKGTVLGDSPCLHFICQNRPVAGSISNVSPPNETGRRAPTSVPVRRQLIITVDAAWCLFLFLFSPCLVAVIKRRSAKSK